MQKLNKKAFTLIELIVVMAVISVFVLLAIPKFVGYTEKARLTEVKNNMKQVETASERYYVDNQEWPRLSDTPYTVEQLEVLAQQIKDKTGKTINLDSEGKYYSIDYNKLQKYVQKPKDYIHYIIQNPVGEIYYLDDLTIEGKNTLESNFTNNNSTPEPSVPQPIQAEVPEGWVGIYTVDDLNNIRNNLSGKYILMENLDLNIAPYNTGTGWNPIGGQYDGFKGIFDGNGLIIDNLYINNSSLDAVGLFRTLGERSKIINLSLFNVNITGHYYVGGLAGTIHMSEVTNCGVNGDIKGFHLVGGISGIVGYTSISRSYVNANVDTTGAAPNVTNSVVGGMVGSLSTDGKIYNSYAMGSVKGRNTVGGIVGDMYSNEIHNSYSISKVEGIGSSVGGVAGYSRYTQNKTYFNVYWDIETSGMATNSNTNNSNLCGYAVGLSKEDMYKQSSYKNLSTGVYGSTSWDFDNIWIIDEGNDYPRLRWENR